MCLSTVAISGTRDRLVSTDSSWRCCRPASWRSGISDAPPGYTVYSQDGGVEGLHVSTGRLRNFASVALHPDNQKEVITNSNRYRRDGSVNVTTYGGVMSCSSSSGLGAMTHPASMDEMKRLYFGRH
jgi:hypothetical protein